MSAAAQKHYDDEHLEYGWEDAGGLLSAIKKDEKNFFSEQKRFYLL